MKRTFIFLTLGVLGLGLSTPSFAQRQIGAEALILDDHQGHAITVQAPHQGTDEWSLWQASGFQNFVWSAPVPPKAGTQGGFLYSGPLTGTVTPPLLPYWVPPGKISLNGNGDDGGVAGAWDYASTVQLDIVAGDGAVNYLPKWKTDGHSVQNSSLIDNGSFISTNEPLHISCSASGTSLNSSTDFVDFVDGTGHTRGNITGNDVNDLTDDAVYKYNQGVNDYNIASCVAHLIIGVADIIAAFLPTEIPICIIDAFGAAFDLADNITGIVGYYEADNQTKSQLGVAYSSSSGDYAEYLRRADTTEQLTPGDIVGVRNGLISKKTVDAQSVLSISRAPIVLGNTPPKGEEAYFNKVAFLGQVPVKVRGVVHAGDFIVPSGLEDGTGVAISPDKITPDLFTFVVGRTWTSSNFEGINIVTVATGLNAKSMSEIMSHEQCEIDSLKEASTLTSMKLDLLTQAMLQTDATQREALLNKAQQLTTSTQWATQMPSSQQNIAGVLSQGNGQASVPPSTISQRTPAQSSSLRTSSKAGLTPPSFSLSKEMQQAMAKNVDNNLNSESPSNLIEKVQKLKSYASAKQSIVDNIDKIMKSSDSRVSKGERIKQFLMSPDEATNRAIRSCAFEVINGADRMTGTSIQFTK